MTVFLLVIAPYNFDPVLTPFLLTMRRSALAVLVFVFHCLFHWFRASALIFLMRADFKGSWLNGWLSVGSVAALFASVSARSLPSMFACPGIHMIAIWRCGCWATRLSTLSRISRMMAWPDCLHGLATAFMAA